MFKQMIVVLIENHVIFDLLIIIFIYYIILKYVIKNVENIFSVTIYCFTIKILI